MKRLGLCSVLAMAMLACNGNEPNTPDPAPPSPQQSSAPGTPSVNVVDGDPPHFQNVIWMTANSNFNSTVSAACVGTVTMYRLTAKRKHKIRWYIQNDPYNGCPDLDESMVELRFNNAIMAEGVTTSEPTLNVLKPKGGQTKIEGRVHSDVANVPNKVYKYLVFYKSLQASPDPELDINGDCGTCGPGGGTP